MTDSTSDWLDIRRYLARLHGIIPTLFITHASGSDPHIPSGAPYMSHLRKPNTLNNLRYTDHARAWGSAGRVVSTLTLLLYGGYGYATRDATKNINLIIQFVVFV